jgi:6-phosphogluconolactonase
MALLCFIGTQGEGPGEGINAARLDPRTGDLTDLGCVAEEERPTFTLPDPARPLLFAVSEVGNRDDRHGAIMSYRIADRRGRLAPLGRRRTGGGPTHLELSRDGGMLYCANFGGPQAVAVPVAPDGQLAPISAVQVTAGTGPHKRQTVPHPHGVTLDPSGRFLLVPDMGADRIFVYHAEGTGLAPAAPPFVGLPSGCGPRFVLFGPTGRLAYVLTELSAEIIVLDWQEGGLSVRGRLAIDPADAPHDRGAAAFGLSRDGRFLYASNRGTHRMQVWQIDPGTGGLSLIQQIDAGGLKPWGLCLSPCGRWMLVANQASDAVTLFHADPETGLLAETGTSLAIRLPTSVAFVAPEVSAGLA